MEAIQNLNRDLELNRDNFAKSKSLSRLLSFRKSKLRHYLEQLKKYGQGNFVVITYEIDDKKYFAAFTNIKRQEAVKILEFRAIAYFGKQIKILEIKDSSTSINNLIL